MRKSGLERHASFGPSTHDPSVLYRAMQVGKGNTGVAEQLGVAVRERSREDQQAAFGVRTKPGEVGLHRAVLREDAGGVTRVAGVSQGHRTRAVRAVALTSPRTLESISPLWEHPIGTACR